MPIRKTRTDVDRRAMPALKLNSTPRRASMTKFATFTFGASLLAAAAFSSAALAQSVNLQFGGPLGNFTAQRNQPGTAGAPGPKSNYDQYGAERKAAQARAEAAARERARLLAAKNSGGESTTVKSTTVKSDDAATTPAAPMIVVPPSPPVATTPAAPESSTAAVVEPSPEPATTSDPPAAAARGNARNDSAGIGRKQKVVPQVLRRRRCRDRSSMRLAVAWGI